MRATLPHPNASILAPARLQPSVPWIIGGLLFLAGCGARSPEEVFQQGFAAVENGDNAAAIDALNELKQHPEYSDHVRLLVGMSRQQAGDHTAALDSFSRMDQQGPLRSLIHRRVAVSYYAQGRLIEAEGLFRRVAEEFPDLAEAQRWLGIVYYDLGAYDLAIAHLTRLTELEPDDFRPYRLLALMHRDFERDAESEAFYQKALALSPPPETRREMVGELAQAFISQKKFKEALRLLEPEPADAELLALGARCLMNLAEMKPAARRLAEAARLDADHRTVLMLQAEFAQAENRNSDALGFLRRAVELDPYDIEARYRLALLLQKLGHKSEYSEQIAEWEKQNRMKEELTELNIKALGEPYNSEIRFVLANLCQQLGKDKLAAMWRKAGESIEAARTKAASN